MPRGCTCTGEVGVYCDRCTSVLQLIENTYHAIAARKARQYTPLLPAVVAREAPGERKRVRGEQGAAASIVEPVRGLPGHIALVLSPLRTVSELNVHGGAKAYMRRRRQHRKAAYDWLTHWCPTLAAHWSDAKVTLTRVGPRLLDSDNLQGALKSVRDGVADWWDGSYLHGDDQQVALTWNYGQKKGKAGQYEVEIFIERVIN